MRRQELLVFLLGLFITNFLKANPKEFTDQQLLEFEKSQKSFILFTISPHMPLSYLAHHQIQLALQDQKIELVVLIDPKVAWEEHVKMAHLANCNCTEKVWQLKSKKLFSMGLHLHYPSVLMINQGVISPRIYPGHKFNKNYQDWLKIEKKLWN